jgi:hypothetical protein
MHIVVIDYEATAMTAPLVGAQFGDARKDDVSAAAGARVGT